MYVCRKVKNSQARTGHQRGMGGRETDDDDTLFAIDVCYVGVEGGVEGGVSGEMGDRGGPAGGASARRTGRRVRNGEEQRINRLKRRAG